MTLSSLFWTRQCLWSPYADLNDFYSRRRGSFTSTLIPSRGITNSFKKSITRETGCFSQIDQGKVKQRSPISCSSEAAEC
jgi:hypothetical protein